jgi:CubicO group peptidase (beta-lactamase class C family)
VTATSTERLSTGLERELLGRVVAAQRSWRAPGVSVGVVRDGALVWSTHVGSARLGTPSIPADDDTQFMIGSVTKTFTALAVMSLRDDGRLSLDDTLDAYVPGSRHGRVPLRQRLAHASGLQREPVPLHRLSVGVEEQPGPVSAHAATLDVAVFDARQATVPRFA